MSNSLRHQAYAHIQRKILCGDLTSGTVLSENALAREIGISRTPVREAIRHLELEGVLKQVPRYGTVVQTLSRRDLVELYELREALEPFAVARAAGNVTSEDLALLEKLCAEIQAGADEVRSSTRQTPSGDLMQRLLSADLSFHMVLLRNSGNRRLMKIVGDSRLLAGIFGTQRQEHDLAVLEETHHFHRSILEAVRVGDSVRARDTMAAHIRASRQQALDHFDRMQSGHTAEDTPLILPDNVLADLQRFASRPPQTV
ncbi:MAG: hypothetical protein RLZZ253_181 [Verrucomicrobiota bacterium]|jgi:DNA-binding GntR family transcriptional regulator